MAQYRAGSVSVTAGSAQVVGDGTSWAGTVEEGHLFNIVGSLVTYSVASVTDDTNLTLTRNYLGVTEADVNYSITRDFTPRHSLPYLSPGDDASAIVAKLTRDLDSIIPAGAGNTIAGQGEPGEVIYPHWAWAEDNRGTGFSLAPTADSKYLGISNSSSIQVPTDPTRYAWMPLFTLKVDGGAFAAGELAKLDGIAVGAEVNVQPDWDEADTTADAFILNKPTIPIDTTLWKGMWAAGVHAVGDIVIHEGGLFMCVVARTAADTGSPDTDTTSWQKIDSELANRLQTAAILPADIEASLTASEVPVRYNRANKTLEVGEYIANPAIDEREVTIGTHTTHGVGFVKGLMGSMDNRRALIDGVEYEITGAFMPPGSTDRKFRFLFNSAVANFPTGETLQVTHSTPTVTVTFVISAGTVRQYPIGDTTHHGVEWNIPTAFRTFLSGNLGATFEVALLTSDQAVNLKRIQAVQPDPELMNRIACSPIGIKTFLHEGMTDYKHFITINTNISNQTLFTFGAVIEEYGIDVGVEFPSTVENFDFDFVPNVVFQLTEDGVYEFELILNVVTPSTSYGLIAFLWIVSAGNDDLLVPSTEAAYQVPYVLGDIPGVIGYMKQLVLKSRRVTIRPEDKLYFVYYSDEFRPSFILNASVEIRRIE